MNHQISYFKNITSTIPLQNFTIQEFIQKIKDGFWNDSVSRYREGTTDKKNIPYVTVSGTFSERKDAGIITHSGLICIDIDNVLPSDFELLRQRINGDQYTLSSFTSVSGTGLAIVVRIDPKMHKEAFMGLQKYYLDNYQLQSSDPKLPNYLDEQCKDISRPRYVSFDQAAFASQKSKVFKEYIKESKAEKKFNTQIYHDTEIDNLVKHICTKKILIGNDSYSDWLRIGFAFADEFGERGRSYYHSLSQTSSKYDQEKCDKQYNHCLKSATGAVGIGTLFFFAKQAGIDLHQIVMGDTKFIVSAAKNAKRDGRKPEGCTKMLAEVYQIPPEKSENIIQKVFERNIDLRTKDEIGITESIQLLLSTNYPNLRRNLITNHIDNGNVAIEDVALNSIYCKLYETDDRITFQMFNHVLNSDFTKPYNPIIDFIKTHDADTITKDCIDRLALSIQSDSGLNVDDAACKGDYVRYFITKWGVSMIASVFGNPSPLFLVLCGVQNSGKTEFFRRLWPSELKRFYAESSLCNANDSDNYTLMGSKLCLMNDELSGMSSRQMEAFKSITSKDVLTFRMPYDRCYVERKRLAVFCGTTNLLDILSDFTGNRRLLPINVLGINFSEYNSIDKTQLFMEFYRLYQAGYNYNLTREDITLLNLATSDDHEVINMESEMISYYFEVPTQNNLYKKSELLTTSRIKDFLETNTKQKYSLRKIGIEMKKKGFTRDSRNYEKVYRVIIKEGNLNI